MRTKFSKSLLPAITHQFILSKTRSTITRSAEKYVMKKIKNAVRSPQNEVSILQKIDHPNVVKVIDSFKIENEFYVVFERAECALIR